MDHRCAGVRHQRTGQARHDVGDIFRAHGPAYREQHALDEQQKKVLALVAACRTPRLGGHLEVCTACGHHQIAYHSCRDRHCPNCNALKQAVWINARLERLLPVHHFHLVFTLPAALRPLALRNRALVYEALFDAAAATLHGFGHDERFVGGQIGFTAVLHTWDRQMRFHPHLHCIVAGGGLSSDRQCFKTVRKRFIFPVHKLSLVFRAKFVARLRSLYLDRQLELTGPCQSLRDPTSFAAFVDGLFRSEWVVYAKRPFGGPHQIVRYLGRYTHRVAISNQRLLDVSPDQVTFLAKDGQRIGLSPHSFIHRFLLHVLPPGFHKMRHYGLFAPANVHTKLLLANVLCIRALNHPRPLALPATWLVLVALFVTTTAVDTTSPYRCQPPQPQSRLTTRECLLRLTGIDLDACPACGQTSLMRVRFGASCQPPLDDTS